MGTTRLLAPAAAMVAMHLAAVGLMLAISPEPQSTGETIRVTLPALCVVLIAQVAYLSRSTQWTLAGVNVPTVRAATLSIPVVILIAAVAVHGGLLNLHGIDSETWVVVIAGLTAVAAAEEITYRGILLGALMERFAVGVAIVVSSAVFGLSHIVAVLAGASLGAVMPQVVGAGLLGVLLAILRVRGGTIWHCIVLHGLWNFAVISGRTEQATPAAVQLAGALTVLAMVAFVVVAVLHRRSCPDT